MTASRFLALRAAMGLAAVLGCCSLDASEPVPAPRPVARETPAFRAPQEPPPDTAVDEPLAPEPAAPLALPDAMALALMQNPELATFSWEVRAGEARALQAGKPPNPELDLRLYSLGIPRGNATPGESRWRAMYSQELELGAKARRRFELAQTERDLAEWDYEAKRDEVATEVVGRFVAVLGAQRRVETLGQSLHFFEQMRERVRGLVASGRMRNLETHQIARRVGLARIELRNAESVLSVARFALATTWGRTLPRFTEAVGDLEQVQAVPDLDTVIGIAQENPAVARWDAELERGKAALALAKAERVPDLTAGAGVRWQEHTHERDWLVDVEITLPLLDRKQGDILEARYTMARARAGRRAAEAARSEEIAAAYNQLAENLAAITTLSEEVLPAVRAMLEAHRAGLERRADNLGDLLDARRDLERAELQYTDALVGYHRSLAVLEALVDRSLTANP